MTEAVIDGLAYSRNHGEYLCEYREYLCEYLIPHQKALVNTVNTYRAKTSLILL
jgi:hypothetical protein